MFDSPIIAVLTHDVQIRIIEFVAPVGEVHNVPFVPEVVDTIGALVVVPIVAFAHLDGVGSSS